MSKRYAIVKPVAGIAQCLAHIAEQKKLRWRYAIGMGGNPALTDVDLAIRKQLAEMIIRPTITEAELKHLAL